MRPDFCFMNAHVDVNNTVKTVHIKNTGQCKDLLLSGRAVRLEVSDNPKRKTKYDLVSVYKQGLGWVNMDILSKARCPDC